MNDDIIARAAEFIATMRLCALALIDSNGYPTAATITPSKTDGIGCVYFGNNIGSNWAKRAVGCSRASVCFNSDRPEYNVTLVGDVKVVTGEPELKKQMWRGWMEMYYTGPDDPNYCVLRFRTRRYSIYMDGQQVRGTI